MMKTTDDYYKIWCGTSHLQHSGIKTWDSAEASDFAEFFHKEKLYEFKEHLKSIIEKSTCDYRDSLISESNRTTGQFAGVPIMGKQINTMSDGFEDGFRFIIGLIDPYETVERPQRKTAIRSKTTTSKNSKNIRR